MKRTKIGHNKRVRNLIIIFALTAIIVSVSTYAWFVGLRTVNVSPFDIEISAVDSLSLSLTGSNFSESITINSDNFSTAAYEGNKNSWSDGGLIPMSSVGVINPDSSRLTLYEKASYTATDGGYRLMASEVLNTDPAENEPRGYVAFDLFIRNISGTQYLTALNKADEEAIYLTVDSEVVVDAAGDGVKNTGIENSVRVAFAQIGRVAATTTDVAAITGIVCKPVEGSKVTGICESRRAQIWEPNDTFHVKAAIDWYQKSCLKRTKTTVGEEDVYKYEGKCNEVVDGLAYNTYAVNTAIKSEDNVDAYDGAHYNGYEGTTKLEAVNYFTDSEKLLTGTARPTFMTLAPSSITKVRIYIYLEGQDIDNYDFASIGRRILVNFGFTKQRFTEDDIDYQGEDVNQGQGPESQDLTAPIITLKGEASITLTKGTNYSEEGVTVTDNVSDTENIVVTTTGTVNTDVVGVYKVTYKAVDEAGNVATKQRTITVTEVTEPTEP